MYVLKTKTKKKTITKTLTVAKPKRLYYCTFLQADEESEQVSVI